MHRNGPSIVSSTLRSGPSEADPTSFAIGILHDLELWVAATERAFH